MPTGTSTTRRSSTTARTSPPIRRCRTMPLRRAFTVDGENGDDESYRVYAEPERFGAGVTVVAAPLTEVDATLNGCSCSSCS